MLKEFDSYNKLLHKKLDIQDGQRIWKHFQRFAEYSDLKDLYNRCIPVIAQFEQKIIEFQNDIDQKSFIIRSFDEALSQKADKLQTEMLQKYMDREFVKTDGITSFKSEIEYSVHKNDQKIKENSEQIQKTIETIEKKVKSLIKKETANLKGSYL